MEGQSSDKFDRTTELVLSTSSSTTVLETCREQEEYEEPVKLYFNGDRYVCPDSRCSIKGSSEKDLKTHIESVHDTSFENHFEQHYNQLQQIRRQWRSHLKALERLKEELDEEVMELQEFTRRFEHGVAVCAVCGDSFDKVEGEEGAKRHKLEEEHNIWFRRLEMPDNVEDPRVET